MIDVGHPFSKPFQSLVDALVESLQLGVEQPASQEIIFRAGTLSYPLKGIGPVSGLAAQITGFVAGCVLTYGDLLHPGELMIMAGTAALSLLTGWQVLILRLDAPGHRRALIVGSRGRIWKIFRAIRAVRAGRTDPSILLINED